MNRPVVSVIIAAYNHEKFIGKTILSLIEQTYKNVELIVIDDGSSDSTYKKMLELEDECIKRFKNVIFKTHDNVGCCMTTNELFDLINGEYAFLIASDDIACPNAIEELLNFLESNKEYICAVGDNSFIDSNSKPTLMDEEKNIVSEKSFHEYKTFLEYAHSRLYYLYGKKLYDRNYLQYNEYLKYSDLWFDHLVPIGCLIRTSALRKIPKYNYNTPVDDVYLHFQLTKIGKVKILDKVLVNYRLHPNQQIRSKKDVEVKNRTTRFYELYLLDKYSPELITNELSKSFWYLKHRIEWEKSKKSKYWDENFYVKEYPEVLLMNYIPLVHYLSIGIYKGYVPNKFFKYNIFVNKKRNLLFYKPYSEAKDFIRINLWLHFTKLLMRKNLINKKSTLLENYENIKRVKMG